MLEATDKELSTQRGMERKYSVQYPTSVDQQKTVPGHGVILVLNALVKDL